LEDLVVTATVVLGMFERSSPVLLPETFTLKINMTSATVKVLVRHMSLLGCVCGKRCTVAERATYQIHGGFELLELVEEVTSIRRIFLKFEMRFSLHSRCPTQKEDLDL